MSDHSSASRLDDKRIAFKRKFLLVACGLVVTLDVVNLFIALLWRPNEVIFLATAFVVGVASATAGILAYRHKLAIAASLFIYTLVAALGLFAITELVIDLLALCAYFAAVVAAAFLVRPKHALLPGIITAVIMIVTALRIGGLSMETNVLYISAGCMVALSFVIYQFANEAEATRGVLRERLATNDELFREVPDAASRLGTAAAEIAAMTEQQTQGTLRQASAIEETRQVLQSVSQAAEEIVTAARETLQNAATTLDTAERVAQNVQTLSEHTRDIFHILELIKDVANKSDLLALNAALEGTKAGDAGRGFSLVATQMQRLAEHITVSVKDIQELTGNIGEATTTTQLSMEEATKLARATTAASEQINLITQQQRTSVEQVAAAMDDIASITNQVASGTNQAASSTDELKRLAQQLTEVVETYRRAAA